MSFETRISAGAPRRLRDLRELWEFRDLLLLMVRREYYAKYAQTLLGPMWFLVQPLLTTLVFTFVFAGVARISTSGAPPMLFYLCGMVPWGYFAATFSSVSSSLTANAGVFSKVYFPRLIVPLSYAISNLFALGIQLGLLVLVLCFYARSGAVLDFRLWHLAVIPLAVVQAGILGVGAGLWMAALTTKYKDLVHVSGFFLGLLFYATPIVFPLEIVPERLRWAVNVNPLTFPIEAFRSAIVGGHGVNVSVGAGSVAICVLVFLTGIWMFQRAERTFIDTV